MIKRLLSISLIAVMFLSLIVACGGGANNKDKSSQENQTGTKNNEQKSDEASEAKNDELKGEIVVGGWPSGDKAFEAIIPEFNKRYPDIKVTLQFQKTADHHNKLLTSLAAGAGAPDVAMIESGYVGKYRDKKGFVNLLDMPYDAKRFESDFIDYKWQMSTSLDGKQLIGLPWDIGPITLFYRRDVFKEVGLPDDPAEVQKLLSTWDGYLDVARKVSIPGERWMVSNAADVFMARWANRDFYNEDLSFKFDTPDSLSLLETASKIRSEGLDAKVKLWETEWTAMLKDGKIATQIAGGWFGGFIKDWIAPDTAGKWGIVSMPGTEVTNWGGSFLAIPEQSKNKEAAWAFIEFALTTEYAQNEMFKAVDYFPAYKPAWNDPLYHEPDPFFGGIKTREFWVEVSGKTKPSFVTIMDRQTEDILRTSISTGLDQGVSPKEVLDKAKQEVLSATEQDRKLMEELLDKAK